MLKRLPTVIVSFIFMVLANIANATPAEFFDILCKEGDDLNAAIILLTNDIDDQLTDIFSKSLKKRTRLKAEEAEASDVKDKDQIDGFFRNIFKKKEASSLFSKRTDIIKVKNPPSYAVTPISKESLQNKIDEQKAPIQHSSATTDQSSTKEEMSEFQKELVKVVLSFQQRAKQRRAQEVQQAVALDTLSAIEKQWEDELAELNKVLQALDQTLDSEIEATDGATSGQEISSQYTLADLLEAYIISFFKELFIQLFRPDIMQARAIKRGFVQQ